MAINPEFEGIASNIKSSLSVILFTVCLLF